MFFIDSTRTSCRFVCSILHLFAKVAPQRRRSRSSTSKTLMAVQTFSLPLRRVRLARESSRVEVATWRWLATPVGCVVVDHLVGELEVLLQHRPCVLTLLTRENLLELDSQALQGDCHAVDAGAIAPNFDGPRDLPTWLRLGLLVVGSGLSKKQKPDRNTKNPARPDQGLFGVSGHLPGKRIHDRAGPSSVYSRSSLSFLSDREPPTCGAGRFMAICWLLKDQKQDEPKWLRTLAELLSGARSRFEGV